MRSSNEVKDRSVNHVVRDTATLWAGFSLVGCTNKAFNEASISTNCSICKYFESIWLNLPTALDGW